METQETLRIPSLELANNSDFNRAAKVANLGDKVANKAGETKEVKADGVTKEVRAAKADGVTKEARAGSKDGEIKEARGAGTDERFKSLDNWFNINNNEHEAGGE